REMGAHFVTLLEAVSQECDRRLSELSLMSADKRHRILFDWNRTEVDFRNVCVHRLFEEQAARAPDAIAVVHEERVWTYAELNHRADRLAARLRRRDVGPESLVALYAQRSPETVAAILGVLKAGGAYLTIDPDLPGERVVWMLADAQPRVVL